MYGNAIDFYILILYSASSWNPFSTCDCFLVVSLGFFIYKITSSANRNNFISSFPIWMFFITFYFQLSQLEFPVARVGFHSFSLLEWRSSFYSYFVQCWYHERVLDSFKCFFCIYWDYSVVFAFYSIDMVYYIHWSPNVKPTLISGINSTWSWYIIIFSCRILLSSISSRIFAPIIIKDNSLYISCKVFDWPFRMRLTHRCGKVTNAHRPHWLDYSCCCFSHFFFLAF